MGGRMKGLTRRLVFALLTAALLAACGGDGNAQATQTEHYKVQLSIDGQGFGERTATIEVRDLAGQPVSADQVVLVPIMETMGMAAQETFAQPIAPGRYQARGAFFSMLGEWEVDVRVRAGGAEEVARFKVPVNE